MKKLLIILLLSLVPSSIFDLPLPVKLRQQVQCPTTSGNYCLAVKYVVYMDTVRGLPVSTSEEAQLNIAEVNDLWDGCKVDFVIETYMAVDPTEFHLNYKPSTMRELDQLRMAFEEPTSLLVATTGPWQGDLHQVNKDKTTVVAWSAFPLGNLHGATMDFSVRDDSQIIAHELGHYLGLEHLESKRNIMNPVVYPSSNKLTQTQCILARSTISKYWGKMTR